MTAHGTRATRTDRRNTLIGHMERKGFQEAEAFEARINAAGLDVFPRGEALVAHVRRGLLTVQTAAHIAAAAGYTVDRCAQLIARAHHAPLAREFLARARADESFAAFRNVPAVPVDPEVETWVERPAPTLAEVIDELEDAAVRGADWESVAHMFGIKPGSLFRRVERAGLVPIVKMWHPSFTHRSPRAMRKPVGLCSEGHPVVKVGGTLRCRTCEVAA